MYAFCLFRLHSYSKPATEYAIEMNECLYARDFNSLYKSDNMCANV